MRRRLHIVLPLLLLALALGLRAYEPQFIHHARLLLFDSFLRLEPREYDPGLPVRIVDLDDATLERLGQWPWPRTLVAQLVDRLQRMGAVIVFDIVFAEPDRTSPSRILPLWPQTPEIEALAAQVDEMPDNDAVLGEIIGQGAVVTGFSLVDEASPRLPEVKGTFAIAGDDPRRHIGNFPGAVTSLPELEAGAWGNGFINSDPDPDGINRRVPLVLRLGDTLYPSIAAEALRVAQGAETYVVKASGASGEENFGENTGVVMIRIGDFFVPTDGAGNMWVHYTGTRPERYIPAWEVLEPDFDPERVAGRIIFIGTSAAGLKDIRATPLDPVLAGVEIHAEAAEQIFAGDFILRPDLTEGLELVYLLAVGLLVIFLIPWFGARWSGVFGVLAIAGAIGASWYAFAAHRWLLDPLFPSIAILLVYILETGIIFLRTEGEKRWVRNAFGRYLSPAVVDQLAEDPGRLSLGGEMRDMTILFCDIRGFTTISEQFDAQGLTRFRNRFLTPMTELILAHRGTIDKYMGDAIMAFWNAPMDDPEHALQAGRTSLAMVERLAALNTAWRAEAEAEGRRFIEVRMGVGISTGECCVGNLGSDQRFDYSVIGDEVNLASRLEGQTKTYGVPIAISEAAATGAQGLAMLELDLITVRGKTRPERVFALLGDEAVARSEAHQAHEGRHRTMLAAYRGQDWAAAERLVAECRTLASERLAALYDLYAERIRDFRAESPGAEWDGVFVALRK